MISRKKPGVAFWTTVVVVVAIFLSAIYLGAYAWIVEPKLVVTFPAAGGEHRFVVPDYHRLSTSLFWRRFFRLANQVDRWARPEVWRAGTGLPSR